MSTSITVCIPAFNEGYQINDLLKSLYESDLLTLDYEIILCDSGSEDGTREIVEKWKDLLEISFIENPGANASENLNKGLKNSKKEIFCRIDARARVKKNYFCTGSDYLNRLADTHCGVGPSVEIITQSGSRFSTFIGNFFKSPFFMGPSHFKKSFFYRYFEGDVDTLYLGFFWTDELKAIEGFNPNLPRKQDIDLFKRLKKSTGKKLLISCNIMAIYQLKHDSFFKISERAFTQGTYASFYSESIRPSHLIPFFMVFSFVLLLLVNHQLAFFLGILYGLLMSIAGYLEDRRSLSPILALVIFPVVHLTYVIGNLRGMIMKIFSNTKIDNS